MARLFGKEYHELSGSWSFVSRILDLSSDEVTYQAVTNEKGFYIIRFSLLKSKSRHFSEPLIIIFDPKEEKIVSFECSQPLTNRGYNFYYSILNYAYHNLSTDLAPDKNLTLYNGTILAYNSHWQSVSINGKIELEGLYDKNSNKVRFYFIGYEGINLRNLALYSSGKEIPHTEKADKVSLAEQIASFKESELSLILYLNSKKCSFSKKHNYFTLYKRDLINALPLLKDISGKVHIRETGESLIFEPEPYSITLNVVKISEEIFAVKLAGGQFISSYFIGNQCYILIENRLHTIQLPFKPAITEQIFTEGYFCSKTDLIYLATIVAKQTTVVKCYLDFSEEIELPVYFTNSPQVKIYLNKREEHIILTGFLEYESGNRLPFNVIDYESELIGYRNDSGDRNWYYLPYGTRKDIQDFLSLLPSPDNSNFPTTGEYVYSSVDKQDQLKKVLYEKFNPDWDLALDEELKQEYISKATIKPIITVTKTDNIDWFEYQVEYKINNVTYTHQELKSFFGKDERYVKLPDNRLVHLDDISLFTQIDSLVKNVTRNDKREHYLKNYNLTYLFSLAKINQNIEIKGDEYLKTMYSDLLRRKPAITPPVPIALFNIMRSYQKVGFYWLKMLQSHRLGGILADDMGLGKTLQALALLSDFYDNRANKGKKSLVVCPKTLLFNWGIEIEKFHPNLSYTIYEGSKIERSDILENSTSDIVIASYSLVQLDNELFNQYDYGYIILDEAQHIKNPMTLRSKAVKKLRAEHRLALTGTPMENNTVELWSIFDFLMPGYLQNLKNYRKLYNNDDEVSVEKRQLLTQIISPFIFRRKKSEVLLELPDKQVQILYNRMTPQQEKIYLKILAMAKEKFDTQTDSNLPVNFINILTALVRLRQVCNHPGLIDKRFKARNNYSAKLELLLEVIQEAVDNRRKLLVFSQFSSMLKIVADNLDDLNIPYEYMDGKTTNRQARVENFNENDNIRLFLLTLKVGGLGLNLTVADTVIIVDPWWNPMSEEQSIDRVYRIGQTKKVLVYRIITRGTVEEKILQLQDKKRDAFSSVIENSQKVIKNLSLNDLQGLFEYESN